MKNNYLMFTAEIPAFRDEEAANIPGLSHMSPISKRHLNWYPFEESVRTIHFFAKTRTQAARCLENIGVDTACKLSEGKRLNALLSDGILRALEAAR